MDQCFQLRPLRTITDNQEWDIGQLLPRTQQRCQTLFGGEPSDKDGIVLTHFGNARIGVDEMGFDTDASGGQSRAGHLGAKKVRGRNVVTHNISPGSAMPVITNH